MNSDFSGSRDDAGDPVILVHGWGMNASVFEPLSKALSGLRETLCIDLPGYGENPWQAGLSFQQQAARIGAILPRGTLVGWSMGGLYATEIVRQYPGRFSQLILVSSNPCFVSRPGWDCAVNESTFEAFAADLAKGWSATIRRFLSLQMLGDANGRQLVRDLVAKSQVYGEPDSEALRYGLDLLKYSDTRAVLAGLDIPLKMVLGKRDAMVPADLGKEILKVNPKFQVEFIDAAAHAPFLSHPDQFILLI